MAKKSGPPESAAAQLYRLAQAQRLLRLYCESEGHPAARVEDVSVWVVQHPELRGGKPSPDDYEAVERKHPDLTRRASMENPYLSGRN